MISSLSKGVGEERANRSRKTNVHRVLECALYFRGMDVSSQVLSLDATAMQRGEFNLSGSCLTRSSRVQVPSWRITQRDSNEKAKQTSRLGVQQQDLSAHGAEHVTRRVHESKIRKRLEQNKHRQETCEPVKCSALQGQPRATTSQFQHRAVLRELKTERSSTRSLLLEKRRTITKPETHVTTEPSLPGARTHHEVRISRDDGATSTGSEKPSKSRKPT